MEKNIKLTNKTKCNCHNENDCPIEDWSNSRQYVYWSQMDTEEAKDYEDSK